MSSTPVTRRRRPAAPMRPASGVRDAQPLARAGRRFVVWGRASDVHAWLIARRHDLAIVFDPSAIGAAMQPAGLAGPIPAHTRAALHGMREQFVRWLMVTPGISGAVVAEDAGEAELIAARIDGEVHAAVRPFERERAC